MEETDFAKVLSNLENTFHSVKSLNGKAKTKLDKQINNAIKFVENEKVSLHAYQLAILLKNELRMYSPKLEKVILEVNNVEDIYNYAIFVKNSQDLGTAIAQSKNLLYNFAYLTKIITANFRLHEQVFLDAKDPEWCYTFAKTFPNAYVSQHERIVLDSGNLHACMNFAQNVPLANIPLFDDFIVNLNNPILCYNFVKLVPKANVRKHGKVVIAQGDAEINYHFSCFNGADVHAHGKVVIEKGTPELNYKFVITHRDNADTKAHAEQVFKCKDQRNVMSFTRLFVEDEKERIAIVAKVLKKHPESVEDIKEFLPLTYCIYNSTKEKIEEEMTK